MAANSITIVSVTGVDPEAHQSAIDRTADALPFHVQRKLHVVGGMDLAEYSRFMVQDLHSIVDTDFALTVQADGYGVHGELWSDEFLGYDYIGAPWEWEPFTGNGGLSIRSRKFMLACQFLPKPEVPEDIHLCCTYREQLIRSGIKFAPPEVAIRFSFEHPVSYFPYWTVDMSWGRHGRHHE